MKKTQKTRRRILQGKWNYQNLDKGEVPKGESMTVPNQVLSLRQYVENHTNAIQVPVINGQYAQVGEALSHFAKLDKLEQQNLIREVKLANKAAFEAFSESQYYTQEEQKKAKAEAARLAKEAEEAVEAAPSE